MLTELLNNVQSKMFELQNLWMFYNMPDIPYQIKPLLRQRAELVARELVAAADALLAEIMMP